MMKALAMWCALTVAAFGASAGAYHSYLSAEPERVAVIVDTSYDMLAAMPAAKRKAEALVLARRYGAFGLFTEKSRVHPFAERLSTANLNAYGPRDFGRLQSGPLREALDGADRVIFITNAPDAALGTLPSDWEIVAPAER